MMFAGIAGVSAYMTIGLAAIGWSFWGAMLVSSLAASLIGVILGLPSLRLRGFYFTLCSLVIQTVITLGFVYFVNLTNGDTGISQIPLPEMPGGGKLSGLAYDMVLAALAVIGVIVLSLIVDSQFGRRLVAIREDDGLAETLGIDVTRQKMIAFFVASLFASIGGALYAPYVGFISPRSFDVLVSLNIWLMVAFGGRGTIWGPVFGAVLLAPVPFLLQDYYTIKDVVYGLLIIGVIVLLPAGIVGGLKRTPRAKPAALKPEQRAMSLLQAKQITVRFGGVVALRNVDVRQEANETLGMIGPNGSGKTTFVNVMTGHLKPADGSLVFDGTPLIGRRPFAIAGAGLTRTYQAVRVFGQLTGHENVASALVDAPRPLDSAGVAEAIAWLGLGDRLGAPAGSLTLYEQRRLELLMRLVQRPKLLMLDEPVGGLSSAEVRAMIALLTELKSRCTIFIIEHTMKVIRELADRVVVLLAGEKIADGPPRDILADKRVVENYLGGVDA